MSNFGCHFGSSMPAPIPLVERPRGGEYVAIQILRSFALAEVFWYMDTQV